MIDEKDIEKLKKAFLTKEQFLEYGVTKDDLEKSEHRLEDKIVEFKSEILTGQDVIMGKLDKLLGEKTVGDEQDRRQKKVLEIHNDALKTSKILSEQQATEIDGLRVF